MLPLPPDNNQLMGGTDAGRPRVVNAHIPDLSTATISRLVERAQIEPGSHILLSIPAGPNRAKNLVPALSLASHVRQHTPGVSFTVDIAIDDNEPLHQILDGNPAKGIPGLAQLQEHLPVLGESFVAIRPRIQPVSNSVMEAVIAMREAAENKLTHVIAPRSSRPVSARITRGLKHYGDELGTSSVKIASAPSHALHIDAGSGHLKRAGLEWFSLITTEVANLISPSLFEQLIERKGIFGTIARFAQKQKLKSF